MGIGITGLLLAGGAASAASSIIGSRQQAKAISQQSEYNALVYDQQGEMIKEKKKIVAYQNTRLAAQYRGAGVASAAGRGFELSGSPLAMLIDNETQLQYDAAIDQYNLDIEAQQAKTGATNTRIQGQNDARATRYRGMSNAFSSILNTGSMIFARTP